MKTKKIYKNRKSRKLKKYNYGGISKIKRGKKLKKTKVNQKGSAAFINMAKKNLSFSQISNFLYNKITQIKQGIGIVKKKGKNLVIGAVKTGREIVLDKTFGLALGNLENLDFQKINLHTFNSLLDKTKTDKGLYEGTLIKELVSNCDEYYSNPLNNSKQNLNSLVNFVSSLTLNNDAIKNNIKLNFLKTLTRYLFCTHEEFEQYSISLRKNFQMYQ